MVFTDQEKDFFSNKRIDEQSENLSSIFNLYNNDVKTISIRSYKISHFEKKTYFNFEILETIFLMINLKNKYKNKVKNY